jgi:hypothetical protein
MAGAAAGLPFGTGLAAVFLLGLFGGAHCLGMCGPLVTVYTDRMDGHATRQHALFNLGRTASYATIGAAMGALGATAFHLAGLAAVGDTVRAVAGVAVGVVVIVVGVGYLTNGSAGAAFGSPGASLVQPVASRLTAHVDEWATGPRILGLGAAHGLLPCPLLYPLFLYAFSTGSPVEGAVSLGVFGLGTIPSLFVYGLSLGSLSGTSRQRLHRALGAAFVLLGTVPLAHGLHLVGVHVPHVPLPMP